MALVTAERCFRNAEARPIEATLTFPVPIHAALVGLSARIGERALAATAQRRAAARATYEDTLDRGRTAVLHEEVLWDVHMILVGQVLPGQEVAVTGTCIMPLADSDDLARTTVTLEADLEIACAAGTLRLHAPIETTVVG
jgi:hypothetical protein